MLGSFRTRRFNEYLLYICLYKYHLAMRRFYELSIFLALAFLLASCAETMEQNTLSRKADYQENRELLTKSLADRLSQGVTRTDVEDYLVYRMNISLDAVKDITRYDIDEDAYIFIVNLNEGGWYIFSGDYSSMPLLAIGEIGNLYYGEIETMSNHTQMFLRCVKEYIENNKNEETESVKSNRNNWVDCKRTASIKNNNRDQGETNIESYTDTLIWDYYPGLIQTSWDQAYPFNQAMPKRYTTNVRCPTGCTVIAIAQLLYYTHSTFGFPADTYSNAYCNDYYDDGPAYNFNLSGLTTTGWNQMELEYDSNLPFGSYIPALCALIASRSNTTYSVNNPSSPIDDGGAYGSTDVNNVASTLSSFLLTGASKLSFSKTTVTNEIANSRPVLCGGADSLGTSTGHSFLFDGYIWHKTKTTEIITDENGVEIDRNEYFTESFYWHVNTGEPGVNNHGWVFDDVYFPYYRIMFTGWSQ